MRDKFDNIMDYIEDNLIKTNIEIENGIVEILNMDIKKFKTFFEFLTNNTLANYINSRRFNAIAIDLINDVNIMELVSSYGYSEQSAFSRAIKNYYGVTPNEIRKNKNIPILPKLYFEDFYNDSIKKIRDELYDNFTIDDEFFSYDITDFIVHVLKKQSVDAVFNHKVAMVDDISTRNDYGLYNEPRLLLENVKGLTLIELKDSNISCGHANMFASTFEPISTELARRKVQDAIDKGVEYITSTDMGCLLHLQSYINKAKLPIKCKHIVDILATNEQ